MRRLKAQGAWFRAKGLGFRVQAAGDGVFWYWFQGLGFKAQGAGGMGAPFYECAGSQFEDARASFRCLLRLKNRRKSFVSVVKTTSARPHATRAPEHVQRASPAMRQAYGGIGVGARAREVDVCRRASSEYPWPVRASDEGEARRPRKRTTNTSRTRAGRISVHHPDTVFT